MIGLDDLPAGWTRRALGKITQPSTDKVDPASLPEATYLGLKHIEAHSRRILGHGYGADVKSAKAVFCAGDVLYGKLRPYLNKVAIPDFDGIASTDILVFPPNSQITSAYLARLLNSSWFVERAHQCSAGMELPRTSWKALSKLDVPVPPVAAQQALTDLLDEVDDHRAQAVGSLVRARQALMSFRQAVLASACSGRLTAEWRAMHPDLESASTDIARLPRRVDGIRRGVDKSHSSRIFDSELPGTWASMTVAQLIMSGALSDVKDGNHGANHPKVSEFSGIGLPFITAAVIRDGHIDYAAAPRVSGAALGRLRVGFSYPGDVVLTHKGSVGRVAVADQEAVLTPQTTYYRTGNPIMPKYLSYFFSSFMFYEQLAEVMSQTTRDFVPLTKQYKLTVVLPPRTEQVEIVRRVDVLLAGASQVQAQIGQAAKALDRTGQAALAKAFRGELVS